MTLGLQTEYYERITKFKWESTPQQRAKLFELQLATNALQSAIDANASEGEIDRLTSLKNDAQTALTQALEQSPQVRYTLSAFETEDDYTSGVPPLFERELTGQVAAEHATIYAQLAAILYQDATAKIDNVVQ